MVHQRENVEQLSLEFLSGWRSDKGGWWLIWPIYLEMAIKGISTEKQHDERNPNLVPTNERNLRMRCDVGRNFATLVLNTLFFCF